MGWSFTVGASRSDIIQERTRSWSNGAVKAVCLRHAVRGNVLWTVWEQTFADGRTERFIGCDVLHKAEDGWGYKGMEELMGPCYHTCPLEYLDLVPPANESWREKVRTYHARRQAQHQLSRSLSIGDRVRLHPNTARIDEAEIVSLKPLIVAGCSRRYRISRALIAEILPRNSYAMNNI
ncbi:hypothetical protein [Nitrospira calida]